MEGTILTDVVFHMRERDDTLDSENPFVWSRKTTADLFAGRRVLVFGLPGAFTPTCSNQQLPNYERLFGDFFKAGIDEIYCTSVNDAFTMYQWGQHQGVENVQMLPDGNGDFARSLGMLVNKHNLGFGERSWRYAMVVNDLMITDWFPEDNFMDDCPTDPYFYSRPEYVLDQIS